jgi:Uma2 family endonuclease
MPPSAGITIDEFERLPEALAHNHELVDGELVDVSGNVPQHNLFRDLLARLLWPFAERLNALVITEQEYDFGGNAHGPDVSFISESKRPRLDRKLRVQRFVPDLAIEIVSANDTFEKLAKKAQRYRECGTEEVWIFSLETRQAFLFSGRRRAILEENEEFQPETIPGFAMRIGYLMSRI